MTIGDADSLSGVQSESFISEESREGRGWGGEESRVQGRWKERHKMLIHSSLVCEEAEKLTHHRQLSGGFIHDARAV